MSDESQPKGPPGEGPTKAFQLKLDGWMSELMTKDFGLDADAPAAEQAEETASPPADAPKPPEAPPGTRGG